MIPRLLLALCGLSAVAGVLAAIISVLWPGADASARTRTAQDLAQPRLPSFHLWAQDGRSARQIGQDLVLSGVFGQDLREKLAEKIEEEQGAAAQADTQSDEEQAFAFPTILAAARIDGRPVIYLYGRDGAVMAGHAGESVPGDWIILDITLDQVRVQRGSEEPIALPVFQWLSENES